MGELSFESLWYEIRDAIFDGPVLKQDGVLRKFEELDEIIKTQIKILGLNTDFLEDYLAHIFRELSAGQLRNRILFLTPKSTETVEDDYRGDEAVHLQQMATLYAYSLFYKKQEFLDLLLETPVIRLVYEEIILSFLEYAKPYPRTARKLAYYHGQLFEGDLGATNCYERYLLECQRHESSLRSDRSVASGVLLQIEELQKEYYRIRNEIAVPYYRIVYTLAKNNATNQLQFFDNFQNGTLGLFMAISRYSGTKGTFGSYTTWWVRQQILFNLKAEINLIRIPVSLWEAYSHLEKIKNTAKNDIPMDELAYRSGYTEEKIQNIVEQVKASQPYSLNHWLDNEFEDGELCDVLYDNKYEEDTVQAERMAVVEQWFDFLTPEEALVYFLNHGLFDWISTTDGFGPCSIKDKKDGKWTMAVREERMRQLAAGTYLKALSLVDN